MIGTGVEQLLLLGFKKLGTLGTDGSIVYKKLSSANGAYNASRGARGAAAVKGGAIGGKLDIPFTHPADILTTDFAMVDRNTGFVNRWARRNSVNLPQGQRVDYFRSPSVSTDGTGRMDWIYHADDKGIRYTA